MGIFLPRFQVNTHRKALHNFGEVAGGIVWRYGGEADAAGRPEAFDASFKLHTGQGIDRDAYRVTNLYTGQLCFAVVGLHIDCFQRHKRQQWFSHTSIAADSGLALGDDATNGGNDVGIGQV